MKGWEKGDDCGSWRKVRGVECVCVSRVCEFVRKKEKKKNLCHSVRKGGLSIVINNQNERRKSHDLKKSAVD